MTVHRTETEIRRAFADAATNAEAADHLGVSLPTAIKLGRPYGITKPRGARKPVHLWRPPVRKKVPKPIRVPKPAGPSPEQVGEAILRLQSIKSVATEFERSSAWVHQCISRWNLHTFTGRPRIADPVAQQQDLDRAIVERAIMLGIWHIDANGDIQQYDKGDPYRGGCPNFLDQSS